MNDREPRAPNTKGYSEAGASIIRRALKGFLPNSGSPQEDIDENNYTLRQRSRLLYMASPVAASAINTNRTKVVGTGLNLRSTLDPEVLHITPEAAREWERRTEAEFALWAGDARNCDALGLNTFASLQQLALKSWLMSGDVFVLLKRRDPTPLNPYGLRLHVVEADRVAVPGENRGALFGRAAASTIPEGQPGAGHKIYDGVEVDGDGCVVAYHICSGYPDSGFRNPDPLTWTRVLAVGQNTGLPNVLHIMDAERPDQYRGVPYLAAVIEPLLQLRRYTESELMAALVQSFFTAWIKTASNPAEIPFNEVGDGTDGETPDQARSENENEYEMGPGTVTHLERDEDIVFGSPNIPTAGFDAFVKALCRQIGAALELPYDVLIKEFNSSYSASRGALLEAWEAIKMRRTWFVDDFCQPVYEIFLAEAVALGRIRAPGFFDDPLLREAWCGARWIGPVQGSLDPLKEARAALLLVDHAFKTHEQTALELGGGNWEENAVQLRRENELLAEAGGGALAAMATQIGAGDGEGGEGGDGEGD